MTEYAPEIIRDRLRPARVSGDELAGHFVRSTASRFLDDLDAAEDESSPWLFEQNRALAPIRFAGMMVNVKGPLTGRRVRLHDFQLFILANLFGFAERRRRSLGSVSAYRERWASRLTRRRPLPYSRTSHPSTRRALTRVEDLPRRNGAGLGCGCISCRLRNATSDHTEQLSFSGPYETTFQLKRSA